MRKLCDDRERIQPALQGQLGLSGQACPSSHSSTVFHQARLLSGQAFAGLLQECSPPPEKEWEKAAHLPGVQSFPIIPNLSGWLTSASPQGWASWLVHPLKCSPAFPILQAGTKLPVNGCRRACYRNHSAGRGFSTG